MIAAVKHITTVSSTDQAMAVAVLLLVAATLVSLITLHLLDRGVKPLSMAVSDYGAGDHAWYYRLAAIWLGLAGLLTAVIVADAMFPKPSLTILCLLVFAATRWSITIFPTDIEGEEQTSVGRTHLVLAVAAFAAFAVAAGVFAPAIKDDPFWADQYDLLNVLGWTIPAVAIALGLTRRLAPRVFGLVERLYYLCMFFWLAAIALIVIAG